MFAAVLKSCGLFIGVDSAGMHIAAAVGTPTVSIFGPSSAASWAPRGSRHKVVHGNLPCIPCRQKGCEGTEQSRCLDELSVNELDGYSSNRGIAQVKLEEPIILVTQEQVKHSERNEDHYKQVGFSSTCNGRVAQEETLQAL
jgi:hypothetical protein